MPSPDIQTQDFIAGTLLGARMKGVSDVHPVTILKTRAGVDHLVVISFDEPYYTAVPLGALWINPDPTSDLYGRVFRLAGTSFYTDPLLIEPTIGLGSDQQWVEVFEFDNLFVDQVYVDSTLDMQVGVTGPRGPDGPMGPAGDTGPVGVQGNRGLDGIRIAIDDDDIARICSDVLSTVFQELPTVQDALEFRYGTSALDVVGLSDQELTQFTSGLETLQVPFGADSVRFSLDQQPGEYGYFVMPESKALLVDNLFTHADSGMSGGWDGARPDEMLNTRVFESYLEHASLSVNLCLYRTDNSGIGNNTWILRLR